MLLLAPVGSETDAWVRTHVDRRVSFHSVDFPERRTIHNIIFRSVHLCRRMVDVQLGGVLYCPPTMPMFGSCGFLLGICDFIASEFLFPISFPSA